jgi:anti-sigma B factor antagonist
MNFSINMEAGLAIFRLDEPRLDSAIAPQVKAELLIIIQEEIAVLIIDLTAVEFCDSSGISALLLARRQMRERDGDIIVVDRNGKVRSLLEIAKLTDVIPVVAGIDEARAYLED